MTGIDTRKNRLKQWMGLAGIFFVCALSAAEKPSPWICDNPSYVKGRFGEAMKFDFWRSRLFLKTPGLLNSRAGTVQFWLSPCKDLDQLDYWCGIFGAGSSKRQKTKMATIQMTLVPPCLRNGEAAISAGIASEKPGGAVATPISWRKGEWHAVAFTWGPDGAAFYLDGKLRNTSREKPVAFDEEPEYLSFGGGTCKRYWSVFANCIMDEIEVSDCVRPAAYIKAYAEAKTPPVPDEHTTALHHCDENSSGYWKMTESYRKSNRPSAVWTSGFFDDYGTFRFGTLPKLPFTLVNPETSPCTFRATVTVKDFNGKSVGAADAAFTVPPGTVEEKYISPRISAPGWYSYRITVRANGRNVMSEVHSFVLLPKASPCAMSEKNYFGNHLCGTRKTDFFTQAGIPWERDMSSFTWRTVQPEQGVWDWRAGDFIVKAAEKNGMHLIGILGHPAAWAATADVKRWAPRRLGFQSRKPRDLSEFSTYVFETVSRYRGRVKYWEIWNEPDWNRPGKGGASFSGTDADYLAVLKTAYLAAKKADPDCVVLSGGFVPHEHQIKFLCEHGGLPYFDILGMHRYRPWADLVKYAKMIGKPAWQTEHLIGTPEEVAGDAINGLKAGFDKNFFQDANTSAMTHFTVGGFEAYGWEPQPVYFAMAIFASKLGGKENCGPVKFDRMEKFIDAFLFDRGKTSQTVVVSFNYSGPNKLKISFVPASDGRVELTGLMGETEIRAVKKGVPLTAEVKTVTFIEGPVDPESFRVASFEEAELLQNSDLKLLEGDIGTDKLEGMHPKTWHLEKERGDIGMWKDENGAYAVRLRHPGESRPVRIMQPVIITTPGYYTFHAEFLRRSDEEPEAYLSIYNLETRKGGPGKVWTQLPKDTWEKCSFGFRTDTPLKVAAVIGLTNGKPGEALMRNPSLQRCVDPELLSKTAFLDLGSLANQSLSDEEAGDGKGGWADMGSANLSLMQTGIRDFGTALFRIRRDGKQCIILGDDKTVLLPRRVDGIPVGEKLKALNFLCTAMNVKAKPGESVGKCIVHYADGSTANIPFVRGKEIDDWFPPMIGKNTTVAENVRISDGSARATFLATWTNPDPDKKITALSFESAGNAVWAILAVSGVKNQEQSGVDEGSREQRREEGMNKSVKGLLLATAVLAGSVSGGNLLPDNGFGQGSGWRSYLAPEAVKAKAYVILGPEAKVFLPVLEKQVHSRIQMFAPVALNAGVPYLLKMTIDSDAAGKITGMYGVSGGEYGFFGINVEKGKKQYLVRIVPKPSKDGKYASGRGIRFGLAELKNAKLTLSDISIEKE